ncbi:MAG: GNAT family N-acetyltransferase [Leptothrix sp. (in: b-proteobacteria)]
MPRAPAPVVRLATPADIPALCELLAVLFSQEAEFVPDRAAQARGLAHVVAQPAVGEVLVACEAAATTDRADGALLGMVGLLYTVSTALGARVALLEDMVVAPSARGAGVGTALLARAVEQARAQGCARITLLTDGGNLHAQRFYVRQGFVGSAMVPMRLALATR